MLWWALDMYKSEIIVRENANIDWKRKFVKGSWLRMNSKRYKSKNREFLLWFEVFSFKKQKAGNPIKSFELRYLSKIRSMSFVITFMHHFNLADARLHLNFKSKICYPLIISWVMHQYTRLILVFILSTSALSLKHLVELPQGKVILVNVWYSLAIGISPEGSNTLGLVSI